MRLYFEFFCMIFRILVFHKSVGESVRIFCEHMGIVYIKFAQILATQNYGNLFTENDREVICSICDDCNPVSYEYVKNVLIAEYGLEYKNIFSDIDEKPIGSASISQVHWAKLNDGREVVIKVKRHEIAKNVERDIIAIKKLVHRFGWIFKFDNFSAGDCALDLYTKWIYEETDFIHERNNIKLYCDFANSVNGALQDTCNILVPRVIEEYCIENIIVMEYVSSSTITHIKLNNENKNMLANGVNSYLKLSFYALFSDIPVVFHGDPHPGNVFMDRDGNIGFLDMGLLFALSENDKMLIREFFFAVYFDDEEQLLRLLLPYSRMTDDKLVLFKQDVRNYLVTIKTKEVSYYFMDMVNICLYYEFLPPNFLFCMAKAFMCLNGISHFTGNDIIAYDLLHREILECYLNRIIKDFSTGISCIKRSIGDYTKNILSFNKVDMKQFVDDLSMYENILSSVKDDCSILKKSIIQEFNR